MAGRTLLDFGALEGHGPFMDLNRDQQLLAQKLLEDCTASTKP